MEKKAEIFIGSTVKNGKSYETINNPYSGEAATKVAVCSTQDVLDAITTANLAKVAMKNSPLYQRIAWLNSVADYMEANSEIFAEAITLESAKPIASSRTEVARAVETIRLTAMEALNFHGELFNSDAMPSGAKSLAYYKRVPLGVVVAITPFNFPVNLIVHKVAPALAAGNSVVLKPAPQTPYCGYLVAKAFIDSPYAIKDGLSVVYGDSEVGDLLVKSSDVNKISFTGSVPVGKIILKNAGLKKVSLELGGNAATYIESSSDLSHAAKRCAVGAFGNAGQVCISLQRIYVDRAVAKEFGELLKIEAEKLKVGSCFDESVFLSAMIDKEAQKRAENWIASAVSEGATLVAGGVDNDGVLRPTVLAGVHDGMSVVCEEVFAPIVSIVEVDSYEEAVAKINASPYGLQFSIFTKQLDLALRAVDDFECGGVVVNDIPTLRFDVQPYGGTKQSGLGREGPKFALEAMSEIKSVVIRG